MDLQECRTELDQIDEQIVKLFEERMGICSSVAEYKIAAGKPVYDGERERQKLSAVSSMAHGDYNQTAVQELFTQIMTISRRYQYRLMAQHGKLEDLGYLPRVAFVMDHAFQKAKTCGKQCLTMCRAKFRVHTVTTAILQ